MVSRAHVIAFVTLVAVGGFAASGLAVATTSSSPATGYGVDMSDLGAVDMMTTGSIIATSGYGVDELGACTVRLTDEVAGAKVSCDISEEAALLPEKTDLAD